MNDLQERLSELFSHDVSVRRRESRQWQGAELAVVEMEYVEDSHSSSSSTRSPRRIRQTAIVARDPQLDLPRFCLQPTPDGVLGGLMSLLGDMGDLDFDDSPEFSEKYHLVGWVETPVRALFTPSLREFFAAHPGWSVYGEKDLVVIFEHNCVQDDADYPQFLEDGLQILSLLQQAEEALDERPEIRREATATDMVQSAQRMGGVVGYMLAGQLKKIQITPAELNSFVGQVPPRTIPRGMKRQVLGDNVLLIVMGLLFAIIGAGVGGGLFFSSDEEDRWVGAVFMIVFPLIGIPMAGLTLRYRGRKRRTLRDGRLCEATIENVKRTGVSVNNQRRYHVTIRYDGSQVAKINAYGMAVELAKQCADSGKTIRILVDPRDPKHVVALDLLTVFD